jgi:Crinkler effector protein N-terminal domain
VLGDDPIRVFHIKIDGTESVGSLRKAIKEEKKHMFKDVDADALDLWKVNLHSLR